MSRHPQYYLWKQELATHLPSLTPALAAVLALWSVGICLTRRCGLDCTTLQVSQLLDQPFDTVRQRLREFYQEANAKRGRGRKDFQPHTCFAPLLRWVLSFWSEPRLALALDVTNLGSRFHVLCVSVLYGGIGIPVAWKILVGGETEAWHPHWCDLLGRLREAVPADWQVVVLTDRGLESPRLFRAILEQGWHPLMRVKRGGKFRPHGWHGWYTMAEFLRQRGDRWVQAGVAYKGELLACTLLACWDEGYEEPWLLLTDLPPGAANPCWYAWRAWIEQGFKVLKSQGLNWQHTRMTQPERAERLFLVLAVTVLWLVVVGAEVEHDALVETMGAWKSGSGRRPRRHRLFECGRAAVIAALLCSVVRYGGKLLPQSWPETWHVSTVTEEEFILKRDLQL